MIRMAASVAGNFNYELSTSTILVIVGFLILLLIESRFHMKAPGRVAKRAALIYSLACSCRLNGINTFDYFKDILNRFIGIKPNTDKKVLRELLPDKWRK